MKFSDLKSGDHFKFRGAIYTKQSHNLADKIADIFDDKTVRLVQMPKYTLIRNADQDVEVGELKCRWESNV